MYFENDFQVIRRDIARTYPEHALFKQKDGVGQESLFNVMKAYSVHDREVMVTIYYYFDNTMMIVMLCNYSVDRLATVRVQLLLLVFY